MNQKELDAIKARCDKCLAKCGPTKDPDALARCMVGEDYCDEFADLAAHADKDIPALLAEVERLNSRLSEFGTIRAQLQTASYSTNKGAEGLAKFILQIWPEAPKEG